MRLSQGLLVWVLVFFCRNLPAPSGLAAVIVEGGEIDAATQLTELLPDPNARTHFMKMVKAVKSVSKDGGVTHEQAVGYIIEAAHPYLNPEVRSENRVANALRIAGFTAMAKGTSALDRRRNPLGGQTDAYRAFVITMLPAYLEGKPSTESLDTTMKLLNDSTSYRPKNASRNPGRNVFQSEVRSLVEWSLVNGDSRAFNWGWRQLTQSPPAVPFPEAISPMKSLFKEENLAQHLTRYLTKFGLEGRENNSGAGVDFVERLNEARRAGLSVDGILMQTIAEIDKLPAEEKTVASVALRKLDVDLKADQRRNGFKPNSGTARVLERFLGQMFCPEKSAQVWKAMTRKR